MTHPHYKDWKFFAEIHVNGDVYKAYQKGIDIILDVAGGTVRRLDGIATGNQRDTYRKIVQELKGGTQ